MVCGSGGVVGKPRELLTSEGNIGEPEKTQQKSCKLFSSGLEGRTGAIKRAGKHHKGKSKGKRADMQRKQRLWRPGVDV